MFYNSCWAGMYENRERFIIWDYIDYRNEIRLNRKKIGVKWFVSCRVVTVLYQLTSSSPSSSLLTIPVRFLDRRTWTTRRCTRNPRNNYRIAEWRRSGRCRTSDNRRGVRTSDGVRFCHWDQSRHRLGTRNRRSECLQKKYNHNLV